MAAELRWILLGLSLPLLVGIWWWTSRRSGQAPGNPELREPKAGKATDILFEDDIPPPQPLELRDWGVPPFEPLNIHTANFDQVPMLEEPMMADSGSVFIATTDSEAEMEMPAPPAEIAVPSPVVELENMPSEPALSAPVAPEAAPSSADLDKIITIRVCAVGETRWSGKQLLAAFESHALEFGRYQVFHRNHEDGRSLFCAASLIEPGTFNIATMMTQEFRGVTFFAVLPGPRDPLETMNELFATARGLAEQLSGMVQDGQGMPMSPQRAAALREDVARFQASLPRN